MANYDLGDFEKLVKAFHSMDGRQLTDQIAKTTGAEVYRRTVKATPVNKSIKAHAGWLRRHWRLNPPETIGSKTKITISNSVYYAEYVEFGHRTRDHKKWVKGRFMLTNSINDVKRQMPEAIDKMMASYIERHLDDIK